MTTRHTLVVMALAIAVAGVIHGPLRAQDVTVAGDKGESVVASPSKAAREALRSARAVEEQARGTQGEERIEILGRAAQAYVEVAAGFSGEPAAVAEASFSAAEIWRKQGDLGTAEDLYHQAIKSHRIRYEARALMQLAHIARRQDRPDEAVEMYQRVTGFKPSSARAHEARVWIAKIYSTGEDQDKAVAAFRLAVERAGSPRRTIDACNGLARLLIKLGQLVEAEEVIKGAELASKQAAGGQDAVDSLNKAYLNMSAHKSLQRAKDKRDKVHEQAAQLEKSVKK